MARRSEQYNHESSLGQAGSSKNLIRIFLRLGGESKQNNVNEKEQPIKSNITDPGIKLLSSPA